MKEREELAALRKLDIAALGARFSELKREQYEARFQVGIGAALPTSEMRRLKRSIARLKTVAREQGKVIS